MTKPRTPVGGVLHRDRTTTPEKQLVTALNDLQSTIAALPTDHSYVFHPGKHLFLTYLKGIVYGLGVLTAVAIIVPLVVSLMRHVQWVPLVGDFVQDIATRMEQGNRR